MKGVSQTLIDDQLPRTWEDWSFGQRGNTVDRVLVVREVSKG